MSSEMTEHICEKDIEENYESFDVIDREMLNSRQQNRSFPSREELTLKFDDQSLNSRRSTGSEKLGSPFENKYALNKDVDLIKTFKPTFTIKLEDKDDSSDKCKSL